MVARKSKKLHVAVVIPAYKVRSKILEVIRSIGPEVSTIVVVDDACPQNSGKLVLEKCRDRRVKVLFQDANSGVGGAVKSGYEYCLATKTNIVVKMDGDGQMDGAKIKDLIAPIANGDADYAKGNRFFSVSGFSKMPRVRLIGNVLLSLISKASSGYWNILDPNNGFTAIDSRTLSRLNLHKISNRYFFESDMLHRLYLLNAKVVDVPMDAIYGDEVSNLSVLKSGLEFPMKHLRNLLRRILITYFVRDFSLPSLQLALGAPLLSFGLIYGVSQYRLALEEGISTPTGTQVLVAISVLGGVQLFSSFLAADFKNTPKQAISNFLQ